VATAIGSRRQIAVLGLRTPDALPGTADRFPL
jgi:hypothetical protein